MSEVVDALLAGAALAGSLFALWRGTDYLIAWLIQRSMRR